MELVTKNAYLLFYAKTSVDYFMRQTLSAPHLWPHLVKFQEALQKQETEKSTKPLMRKQSSTGFRENYRFNKVSSKVFIESTTKKDFNEEESNLLNHNNKICII